MVLTNNRHLLFNTYLGVGVLIIIFNLIVLPMLTLSKKPYNPNYGPSTSEDTNWNKTDILSFLDNIHNVPLNDIAISGKGITFYQTATKAEIVSELICTVNLTHYKLLSAVKDVINFNNLLINQTQKRNDSIDFCVKEIKKLATQTQRNNFLLLNFVHNNHDLPLSDSKTYTDEILDPIIDEPTDQIIIGSPEQTIDMQTTSTQSAIMRGQINLLNEPQANLNTINTTPPFPTTELIDTNIVAPIQIINTATEQTEQITPILTINTIPSQTIFANPRLSNITKKVNESININNNSTANNIESLIPSNNPSPNTSQDKQIIHIQSTEPNIKPIKINKLLLKKPKINVKSPSAVLAVSDLNDITTTFANPSLLNKSQTEQHSNTPAPIQSNKITKTIQRGPHSLPIKPHLGHITNKIKKKKKKKKYNNNKSNIKNKKQRNMQQRPSKHKGYTASNNCTSMVLPYIANKQRKKRYTIINPIREDIDIKTRYGIYRTSKCLEKQIQDILPYEDYTKDEQLAYDELNEKINYAVFNR